ncbi:MAG: acyl-CoA dehydratase activase [Candidatus Cloacimonetes bacterium]|nr:acyl-CoA dehydratase activase [Candidatus Cloacimonadota bacterium]
MGPHPHMITLGIDIGSRNTKIVIFDPQKRSLVFSGCVATEVNPLRSVENLLVRAEDQTGLKDFAAAACTGYGRKLWKTKARVLSEISCHAAGVLYYQPEAKTIIDIGGQDSKIITVSGEGKVSDFVMNDKCAAGTGRFLEMTALRLDCSLDELSSLAAASSLVLDISSTCVVFAESEIVGMVADNSAPADIARAVHNSIAERILTQISALEYQPPVVFTGGVALNADLVGCLSRQLDTPISVPPSPELTGALGAAILAAQ